jgi:hypothetical protein
MLALIAKPPLHSYLHDSECLLNLRRNSLIDGEQRIKSLRQLITKYGTSREANSMIPDPSGPGGITTSAELPRFLPTMPLSANNHKGLDVPSTGMCTVSIRRGNNNEIYTEDVALLTQQLNEEEGMVAFLVKEIQQEEAKIATYRRFIEAEAS